MFGGELDLVGGELDLVGGELDLAGGELNLVGGELDQVQSKWGRTRWGRTRHGAKPVDTIPEDQQSRQFCQSQGCFFTCARPILEYDVLSLNVFLFTCQQ